MRIPQSFSHSIFHLSGQVIQSIVAWFYQFQFVLGISLIVFLHEIFDMSILFLVHS